jgi:hypothetical protein
MDINNYQNYNRNNALLNADNNTEYKNSTLRTFVRFTQRFNSKEETTEDHDKGRIKNAYYSIQLDYSRNNQNTESKDHGDNLFDYGYLGKYVEDISNHYAPLTGKQDGFDHNGVLFTPSDMNPDATAFAEDYFTSFNYFDENGQISPFYQDLISVQQHGGLLNGDQPASVYGLWNNVGVLSNSYSKYQSDQIRVSASGSADIGKHAVSVGVEYEQLTQRSYAVAPVGLWT